MRLIGSTFRLQIIAVVFFLFFFIQLPTRPLQNVLKPVSILGHGSLEILKEGFSARTHRVLTVTKRSLGAYTFRLFVWRKLHVHTFIIRYYTTLLLFPPGTEGSPMTSM